MASSTAYFGKNGPLLPHSCHHCQKIVLPGHSSATPIGLDSYSSPNDSFNDAATYREDSFIRLNVSLRDLEIASNEQCEFACYLLKSMRGGTSSSNLHKVEVFVDYLDSSIRFHGLVFAAESQYTDPPTHGGNPIPRYTYAEQDTQNPKENRAVCCLVVSKEGDAVKVFDSNEKWIALDPLSAETVLSIKNWMEKCNSEKEHDHKICSLSGPRLLPSRLIQITPCATGMRLKLVRGADMYAHDTPEYVALSYCWGGDQPNKLTENNLSSYEEEIPWENLPKTLQDAAVATDLLGIRYLWIDSLCIIQDDYNDKTKEISHMTHVYTHAKLTIMARRGESASDGFLQNRSLPSGTSKLLFQAKSGQRAELTLVSEHALDEEDNSALNQRGWAMQEYLLSNRILIIGTWTTEWSCRKERHIHTDGWVSMQSMRGNPFRNAGWHNAWTPDGNSSGPLATRSIEYSHIIDAIFFFASNPDHELRRPSHDSIFRSWDSLVKNYSMRSLSIPMDRILAISGMAERFYLLIPQPDRYIAGIWESQLLNRLLWECNTDVPPPRPERYQGPSWSWVSVTAPIAYSVCESFVSTVLSVDYELANPDVPFGEVKSAVLHIKGPAINVEWRYERQDTWPLRPDINGLRWQKSNGEYADPNVNAYSDAREEDTDWTEVVLLAIDPGLNVFAAGIILKKGTDGQYRRLGNFFFLRSDAHLPNPMHWPEKTFHIV